MGARGRPCDTTHDALVIEAAQTGASQSSIARTLRITPNKVHRICRRLRLCCSDDRSKNRGRPVAAVSRQYEALVSELAKTGLTAPQIAEKLQIKRHTIDNIKRRLFIEIATTPEVAPDLSRARTIAERYQAGETLAQIGESYGISRERVRQILRARTTVTSRDGGAAIKAHWRRQEFASKQDQKYMDRLGCGWEEYKQIRQVGIDMMTKEDRGRDQTPLGAFFRQKHNASTRGIGWEFNFWDWWSVWQSSGRWHQRGRGQGYVMCRRNDEGPYAPGNVFITTAIENTSSGKHKKSGLPTGVKQRGRRFEAMRQLNGRKVSLGWFDTPGEAYAAYVAAAPGFVPARGLFRRMEKSA